MAKVLKHNTQDKIDQATAQAEYSTFNNLSHDFRKECLKRFFEVKDNIENWQDVIANEALLAGRLQTIAAKDPATWTENNLKDMALISNILWNIEDDGEA